MLLLDLELENLFVKSDFRLHVPLNQMRLSLARKPKGDVGVPSHTPLVFHEVYVENIIQPNCGTDQERSNINSTNKHTRLQPPHSNV